MKWIRKKELLRRVDNHIRLIDNLVCSRKDHFRLIQNKSEQIKKLSKRIEELEHPRKFVEGDKVEYVLHKKNNETGVVISSRINHCHASRRVYEVLIGNKRLITSGSLLKLIK